MSLSPHKLSVAKIEENGISCHLSLRSRDSSIFIIPNLNAEQLREWQVLYFWQPNREQNRVSRR